jgi:tRNA (cmo5U34)-methyltransferase
MTTSLGHVPTSDKWTFDDGVTDCFEDMLRRSIPQYDVMRQEVFEIGSRYVKKDTAVVDLGCSRGDMLVPFVRRFGAMNRFVGVEVSEPMLQAARERFEGLIKCNVVDIRRMDLRSDFPHERASLILSVLTLQFTPIEYRLKILKSVYDHLLPGGAFILVEKVIGASADIDALMVGEYYRLKQDNGYTTEEIERKRLSLEGVLVPVTARYNEELLQVTGFHEVDCFWRYLKFAGWVAIKSA